MSGITDNAATQAHDVVEQPAQEAGQEQKVQGENAVLAGETTKPGLESTGVPHTGDDQLAQQQQGGSENKSTIDKVKEALHLKK